jgi:NAD(P)-dependent dehydrogenase (short-subunit alcohol dehydrogenase family)
VTKPLTNRIAVVAGATRGAGRGIAAMLGEAGATVYCTGRSVRGAVATTGRSETIEETAELVTQLGGQGIPVQVDHRDEAQVAALFARVEAEQGRLDVLVNDIWGGEWFLHATWDKPFWEQPTDWLSRLFETAIFTHIITSRYGAPLLVKQGHGLIVEITDGDTDRYRGNFVYDLLKHTVNRMAFGLAEELRPFGVTALAVSPGFLRSEEMLDHFGVTEENWREGARKEPHFIASETPWFVGRAVAALAADPNVARKAGGVYGAWTLSDEYGFVDRDGNQPHWGRHYQKYFVEGAPLPPLDETAPPDLTDKRGN